MRNYCETNYLPPSRLPWLRPLPTSPRLLPPNRLLRLVIEERIAFLESPKDKLILRFRTFENPECYGDLKTEVIKGQVIQGEHPLLKSRRVFNRKEALDLWHKLQGKGWKQVDAKW